VTHQGSIVVNAGQGQAQLLLLLLVLHPFLPQRRFRALPGKSSVIPYARELLRSFSATHRGSIVVIVGRFQIQLLLLLLVLHPEEEVPQRRPRALPGRSSVIPYARELLRSFSVTNRGSTVVTVGQGQIQLLHPHSEEEEDDELRLQTKGGLLPLIRV